jgi:DsbC/DsbD-like thiol-disulfide interchange protein
MLSLRIVIAASLASLASSATADGYLSDWAVGLKSSARLLAGDAAEGRLNAGVEIKLAPGAITYWRDPGESGLPPVFSFAGSVNLAEARPLFPAPQRLKENDGEAFGYDHSLVLPIEVEAIDPTKPVDLSLQLNYAVCEKICVPAKAALHLSIDPGAAPSPYAAAIAEAKAAAPKPVKWAELAGKAKLAAAGEKSWRLCFDSADGSRDLFVEAPERWWFGVTRDNSAKAGETCFIVKLEQKPDEAQLPVKARLTVTGGAGAFETEVAFGDRS